MTSRPTAVGRLVLAVVVVVSCIVASAVTSTAQGVTSGAIGIRLLDIPTDAQHDPRALLYIVDHVAPGTTIDRRIEISNSSSSRSDVELYAAAASVETGAFIGTEGRSPDELSSWTTVTPPSASIAAGARATALVSIRIPADASPGERYGVVWAETRTTGNTAGINEVSRVGIRLYVSVGPGGAPAADFVIESLTAERSADGHAEVVASVHNTGGRALDLSGSLDLAGGPAGLRAGPFPAQLGSTLAIGATGPVEFELGAGIPAGPWTATITLRSGLVERKASASLTFPDSGSGQPVTIGDGSLRRWLYPVVGLGLAAGAVSIGLRSARRKSRAFRSR
jgi:hypothetical protein